MQSMCAVDSACHAVQFYIVCTFLHTFLCSMYTPAGLTHTFLTHTFLVFRVRSESGIMSALGDWH